jgi:Amt family ammonium transporter
VAPPLLQAVDLAGLEAQIALDSAILSEQFYFFTVALMWLIHAGFLAYEAGVARRKNVMATAMKNILTIAVVTPAFYYVGWVIYGCFQNGFIPIDPWGDAPGAEFCQSTIPWGDSMGPNLTDNITGVFWAAFVLFSWTTGSILSGAVMERIRLSAYLLLTAVLGSVVWILDAAWGWSSGGWLILQFGFHDAIASGVVHGVAGVFALGVVLQLGPRIGRYDMQGRMRRFLPHNLHTTLLGLLLLFAGFYGFYAACLVITSTTFPGWLNIYLSPATLSAITFTITIGFAGGFIGGYFASKGDPFWTVSGGLAGVIGVSAGADIYAPSMVLILSAATAVLTVLLGGLLERRLRVDDPVGAIAVHGIAGFLGLLWVGIFAAGYPTGENGVLTSFQGQLIGILTFFALAFLPAYILAGILRKMNLLRVSPEVELEGEDIAQFGFDFFPEHARSSELMIDVDGVTKPGDPITREAARELPATNGAGR